MTGHSLQGHTALVTGAESGIGRAIATAFAEAGADVAITYLQDAEAASATSRSIEAAGGRAFARQTDVQRSEEVDGFVTAAQHALGPASLLVNAAGIFGGKPIGDLTDAIWDRIVRTNLYGPFYCCRAFVRARRAAGGGGGRIINITSVHEQIPSPNQSSYGAAKGGLLTLTRSLALELAPERITVNAIAPGWTLVRPVPNDPAAQRDHREKESLVPLGRVGRPEEVAHLAVFLASEAADYVTGQSYVIDGGLMMKWGQDV